MSAEDWFLNDYEYGDIEYGETDEPLPTFKGGKIPPFKPNTEDVSRLIENVQKQLLAEEEMRLFQQMKAERKITEPCLILHPKHRNVIGGVFLALGTKFPVVFSECCEEGKAYMITDLDTIERVRGNLE